MSRTLDFTGFSENVSRGSLLGQRMAYVPVEREFSGNKHNICVKVIGGFYRLYNICYLNKLYSKGAL